MKKILKYIAYAIGAVVLFALLLVLTLPLWLGPIFRPAVNVVVPKFTGTSFDLGHLNLNPYTGRFELGDLVVGNPKGYSEPVAVSLSNLVVDVAMTTLADKYIHVEEVTVEGVFVSYIDGGEHDVDNFTQIQYNIAGSKEKYEAAKKKAEQKKAEQEKANEPAEEEEDIEEEISNRKLVIDRLAVRNVRVKYGFVTIPVPVDIVLTDLGKESEGMTFSAIIDEVWKAILKSANAVGNGVKALGNIFGEGSSKLGEGASKATDAVGEGASKAAEAVGDSAKKAADAVGDGAKKATDAVKNMLGF